MKQKMSSQTVRGWAVFFIKRNSNAHTKLNRIFFQNMRSFSLEIEEASLFLNDGNHTTRIDIDVYNFFLCRLTVHLTTLASVHLGARKQFRTTFYLCTHDETRGLRHFKLN